MIIEDENFDKQSINADSEFIKDEEIIIKMKKNNATLKKFLSEKANSTDMKKRVFNVAKSLDLVTSKAKMIEEHTGFSFRDEE